MCVAQPLAIMQSAQFLLIDGSKSICKMQRCVHYKQLQVRLIGAVFFYVFTYLSMVRTL